MPGMFGGIGCADTDTYGLLTAEFRQIWNDSEIHEGQGWALGGHAFGGRKALISTKRYHYAVDGECSIYKQHPTDSGQFSHDFRTDGDVLRLGPNCMGNVALIDTVDQILQLAVEWSGTFPLYYIQYQGGVLFSSHLRPLARVTQRPVDNLALLEFLRNGFTFAGRSMFVDIARVLPGQSIRYSLSSRRIAISEESGSWADSQVDAPPDAMADQAWELLAEATRRSVPATERVGLMMSGGWDSRTLLAALNSETRERLTCYSHGDTAGRELNLVARLASANRVDCRLEPIDGRVLDLNELKLSFGRAENAVFPHWHRAGRLLSEMGVTCTTAGVYGEVLGGHYGSSMLLGGHRTMIAVASKLIRTPRRPGRAEVDSRSKEALLRVKPFGHHWYLRRTFEDAIPSAHERMNEGVESDLERLRRRGVASSDQLVEAFIAEHRGSHYINAQLLSCRSYLDIALPFAEQALLAFVSRVPLHAKVHNTLNRGMLRRHAPLMLRFPMAATLVPAGLPLLLQEASRFLRRTYEDAMMAVNDRTHGSIGHPKLGWVNFEFLRSSNALMHMVEDLQNDYWDRNALEHRLKELASNAPAGSLYPVYNQLAKIYTADLLCR